MRRTNVVASSRHSLRRTHESDERGFAMLVVMLMAAAIAFSLYLQVPRYAFETMREREQLLMDRGNQYKRAIQVYYADNKHYPAKLEDLENTNDKRYLRRRYRDPLTGSDEWRLIHTNGTTLTDSLVQKPPAQNAANGAPGAGILPGGGPLGTNNMNTSPDQAAGGSTVPGQAGAVPGQVGPNGQPAAPVNAAVLRRPSDRLNTPAPGATPGLAQNPGQDNGLVPGLYPPGYNPASYNPNDPSTWPPISLAPVNGQTGQTGQTVMPGTPGFGNPAGVNPGVVNPALVNQGAINQGVVNGQPNFGQSNPAQPLSIPGFGGQPSLTAQQPQTTTQITTTPIGEQTQGVVPTPLPFGPQQTAGSDPSNGGAQQNPFPTQAGSVPGQTGIPGQGPGLGGQNPQNYNPAFGFPGNPFAPNVPQTGQAGAAGAQLNPALQTINSQLSSPTAAPAAPLTNAQMANSPQMAPGIAGVASKFEGASIKVYNKRSKYKEWEFVFDPSTQTTNAVPANGQAAAAQNGQQNGQSANGGAFSIPGFGSTPPGTQQGQPQQTGQQTQSPFNATPSTNPFGQQSNPFGAPTQ